MLEELPSVQFPEAALRWIAATTLAYAFLGELVFQDDRPVTQAGLCGANPRSYLPHMAAWLAVVFIVSTVVLLRRTDAGRRLRNTIAHAGGAAALGMIVAEGYYAVRMALIEPCPGLEFCAWCDPVVWPYVLPVVLGGAAAALRAAVAGAISIRFPRAGDGG